MKIAFCLKEDNSNSALDNAFGRCSYFGFYDEESDSFNILVNEGKESLSGAGALAVQQIVDQGATILIAPELGPKAFPLLAPMGITPYRQADCANYREAYQAYKAGKLEPMQEAKAMGFHKA